MKTNKNWRRDIPDSGLLANSNSNLFSRAASISPDESLIFRILDGDPEAVAIRDSWRFYFPVTQMTQDELEEASERCSVTFTAHESGVSR